MCPVYDDADIVLAPPIINSLLYYMLIKNLRSVSNASL